MCEDIREWLRDLYNIQDDDDRVRVNRSLPCYVTEHGLWVNPRKNPDVCFYSRTGKPLLQIEVLSGDRDACTIFKLALGLIDQNRYLKNRLNTISTTTGFSFPVGDGVVEKVVCSWVDHEADMHFLQMCHEDTVLTWGV